MEPSDPHTATTPELMYPHNAMWIHNSDTSHTNGQDHTLTYQGQTEAIKESAPKAQDMTSRRTTFKNYVDELQKKKNRSKSRVRAKVEHPFRILKRVFGFDKVRYRGIAKNHHRLCVNFALVNLYMHRRRLAVLG